MYPILEPRKCRGGNVDFQNVKWDACVNSKIDAEAVGMGGRKREKKCLVRKCKVLHNQALRIRFRLQIRQPFKLSRAILTHSTLAQETFRKKNLVNANRETWTWLKCRGNTHNVRTHFSLSSLPTKLSQLSFFRSLFPHTADLRREKKRIFEFLSSFSPKLHLDFFFVSSRKRRTRGNDVVTRALKLPSEKVERLKNKTGSLSRFSSLRCRSSRKRWWKLEITWYQHPGCTLHGTVAVSVAARPPKWRFPDPRLKNTYTAYNYAP